MKSPEQTEDEAAAAAGHMRMVADRSGQRRVGGENRAWLHDLQQVMEQRRSAKNVPVAAAVAKPAPQQQPVPVELEPQPQF